VQIFDQILLSSVIHKYGLLGGFDFLVGSIYNLKENKSVTKPETLYFDLCNSSNCGRGRIMIRVTKNTDIPAIDVPIQTKSSNGVTSSSREEASTSTSTAR